MSQLCEGIVVFYASQTGNAESIAKHIHSEALGRGYQSRCLSLDTHTEVNLEDANALVVITSTTGDGDPPDNATKFFRFMRRAKKEMEALKGKPYALLGLGDTNYTNFNQPAKRLDRRFAEVGAVPMFPKALADDATGLEATVDPWVVQLWETLPKYVKIDEAKSAHFEKSSANGGKGSILDRLKDVQISVPDGTAPNGDTAVPIESVTNGNGVGPSESIENSDPAFLPRAIDIPKADLEAASQLTGLTKAPASAVKVELGTGSVRSIAQSSISLFHLYPFDKTTPVAVGNPYPARVTAVRCVSGKKALSRVIDLEIDVSELTALNAWTPVPGDAFGVRCPNPDGLVLPLLQRLKFEPTASCNVTDVGTADPAFGTAVVPTVYEVFRYHLDLKTAPKKSFFRLLAEHATDDEEKKVLFFLASSQGADAYRSIAPQLPTLLDLLHTFPSTSPPLARLIDSLPRLQPRYYSVSNIDSGKIRFAFNIVEFTPAKTWRLVRGLCSTWLDNLTGNVSDSGRGRIEIQDVQVPIFPRPLSKFTLPELSAPEDATTFKQRPVVMVSAGTGITPFISFLQYREKNHGGSMWLLHGHRFMGTDGDALYDAELKQFERAGVLGRYVECISRDQADGVDKYVQDALKRLGSEIWDLVVAQNGYLFVCG
ncbi:hypothetical protein BJ742DRAFT_882010 [Cladochytrium replicatum]|nr:hypothetical protein BJ742DRAFT_882010 [Cladochytrium replicatum]